MIFCINLRLVLGTGYCGEPFYCQTVDLLGIHSIPQYCRFHQRAIKRPDSRIGAFIEGECGVHFPPMIQHNFFQETKQIEPSSYSPADYLSNLIPSTKSRPILSSLKYCLEIPINTKGSLLLVVTPIHFFMFYNKQTTIQRLLRISFGRNELWKIANLWICQKP